MPRPNLPTLDFSVIKRSPIVMPRLSSHSGMRLWGWVIYRTVYTPETKQNWNSVLEKLDNLLLADFKYFNSCEDAGAVNYAREEYRKFVLEDEDKFNNASPEDLEIHFSAWIETVPELREHVCTLATGKAFLVLDAQAFTNILNAAARARNMLTEKDMLSGITIVSKQPTPDYYEFDYETGEEHWLDEEEPEYEHVEAAPSWPGKFPVSIYSLYCAWLNLNKNGAILEDLYRQDSSFKERTYIQY